jgi:hypothetical protein
MSSSKFITVRPDNVSPDASISFKAGFPVLKFTIQSQSGFLDPRSIRINGDLLVFADAARTPVYSDDTTAGGKSPVNMDPRLGIFAMWEQLLIRHGKSKAVCEHIRHYNRYMQTYLALTSSKQDLLGHLNQACLIEPNEEAMFRNIVSSGTAAEASAGIKKSFSCHLPSGFIMSGNVINLMETSFGGIEIELHLSPDSNCLFTRDGQTTGVANAFYELSNLSLSCEVQDIPPSFMEEAQKQTSGALEFNTITSLYTSIQTSNAQLQYTLGLKNLQSCFVTFVPSDHINTLSANGLATTYPAQRDAARSPVKFKKVQWLKGGAKYPVDFDVVGTTQSPGNDAIGQLSFTTSDSQLNRQFIEAVVPEYADDRVAMSKLTSSRDYGMVDTAVNTGYKKVVDGGAVFGLGMRYSKFNLGQDFSREQWGLSLESNLGEVAGAAGLAQSVFMYFKAKAVLVYGPNGVQMIQ